MKSFPFVFLIVFACFGSACETWELNRQELFIEVQLASIDSLTFNSIELSAEIFNWQGVSPIEDHGFVWFTPENPQDQREPDLFFNQGNLSLGALTTPNGNTNFEAVVGDLFPFTPYVFRAYVKIGNEVFYSHTQPYESNPISVATLATNYQFGAEAILQGQLGGTENGLVVGNHGFCWSTVDPEPNLADNSVDLGNRRSNEPFSYTLDGLVDQETYYFRSYAILSASAQVDVVYGQVYSFEVKLNLWTQKTDFPGIPRFWATGFSIGDKGYIGTGGLQSDFWEYDPQSDTWTQKAEFGGLPRYGAVGFSIGNKGYIGTGLYDDSPVRLTSDFWEYDPQANTWTQKTDFGGVPRYFAVGFSIGDKGYIVAGRERFNFVSDFWEYDPQNDTWTKKADFPGEPRALPVAISLENKAYLGTGQNENLVTNLSDFWEYNPQNDVWSPKAEFPGAPRAGAVGFAIGTNVYLGTGGPESDFWEYDPQTDVWTPNQRFLGSLRSGAVGFSIGDKGYVGTGRGNVGGLSDFWEYDP